MHPYAALTKLITKDERARLDFLKAVHLKREIPYFWLYRNPRDYTWAYYWGFLVVLAIGAVLHVLGCLPWLVHLGILSGYLAVIGLWALAFEMSYAHWLARAQASSKCYHDYFTTLARRYRLGEVS